MKRAVQHQQRPSD